jgi:hypothetical protein
MLPSSEGEFLSIKISPYSPDYLNVLAMRGAIPAFKLKRNWVIIREAILKYVKEHKA